MRVKYGWFAFFAILGCVFITGGIWDTALAKEDTTAYFEVDFQQPAEIFLGKGGIFMVSSSYSGTAGITRRDPNYLYPSGNLVFVERWIDFQIYDARGVAFPNLWGFNYVYFNLTYDTRRMVDEGDLRIYHWDPLKRSWIECPTLLVVNENEPHGRAACVMTGFGLYGLAYEK
jgi:hypothetical protein